MITDSIKIYPSGEKGSEDFFKSEIRYDEFYIYKRYDGAWTLILFVKTSEPVDHKIKFFKINDNVYDYFSYYSHFITNVMNGQIKLLSDFDEKY